MSEERKASFQNESRRHGSAIYAGLDEAEKLPRTSNLPEGASVGSGASHSSDGAKMPSPAAAGRQVPHASGAASMSGGSTKGIKIAIVVIAVISIAIIAVSVFALAGGFDSKQDAGDGAVAIQQTEASDEEGDVSAEAGDESASEQADGSASDAADTSASASGSTAEDASSGASTPAAIASNGGSQPSASSSSAASSSTSGGSASSGSSNGGGAAAQQPQTITVSVSVDSSAAGSPVSLSTTVTLKQGSTVYDALAATGVSINARPSQYGIYVAGIGGLAEKEHGGQSGWTYYVNGAYINAAASATVLSSGDAVQWVYVANE